jgi:hypothetical protein
MPKYVAKVRISANVSRDAILELRLIALSFIFIHCSPPQRHGSSTLHSPPGSLLIPMGGIIVADKDRGSCPTRDDGTSKRSSIIQEEGRHLDAEPG